MTIREQYNVLLQQARAVQKKIDALRETCPHMPKTTTTRQDGMWDVIETRCNDCDEQTSIRWVVSREAK